MVRNHPSTPQKGAKARPRFPFRPFGITVFRRFTPWRPLDPLPNQRPRPATGIRWAAGVCNALLCSRPVAGWGTNHCHEHHRRRPLVAGDLPVGFWEADNKGGWAWGFGIMEPVRLVCRYVGSCV